MERTIKESPFLWWLGWMAWIPFPVAEAIGLVQASPPPVALVSGLAGTVLFCGLYAWGTWKNAKDLASDTGGSKNEALKIPLVILLFLLSFAMTWLGVQTKSSLVSVLYFTSAYLAGAFPLRRASWMAGLLILLTVAMAIEFSSLDLAQTAIRIAIVALMVVLFRRSLLTSRNLRQAQEKIGRLAANAERLRIARDLHDLLGHTLSMISLKSELARRLIGQDPDRSAKEMSEVETTARSVLQQVREAVSGYRRLDLASELTAARDLLESAGLELVIEGDCGPDEFSDEALAWAVREGVTNIIRHSPATVCTIRLDRHEGGSSIEILDNGRQPDQAGSFRPGNGMTGLQERLRERGGRMEAGYAAGSGFRLLAAVPLTTGDEP